MSHLALHGAPARPRLSVVVVPLCPVLLPRSLVERFLGAAERARLCRCRRCRGGSGLVVVVGEIVAGGS